MAWDYDKKAFLAQAKKAKTVILATDPDREGEAIAWHVAELIDGKKQFARITFHEITKSAIDDALAHPGVIDVKLVSAQQARRVLDRLVGYKLSPILCIVIESGISFDKGMFSSDHSPYKTLSFFLSYFGILEF